MKLMLKCCGTRSQQINTNDTLYILLMTHGRLAGQQSASMFDSAQLQQLLLLQWHYDVISCSQAVLSQSGAVAAIFSMMLFTWKHRLWICLSHVGSASCTKHTHAITSPPPSSLSSSSSSSLLLLSAAFTWNVSL